MAVPVVDGVEVVGDFVANDGMVRVVGREFDFGGIDEIGLFAGEGPLGAFVGGGEVDLDVEGLALGALVPVGAIEGLFGFEVEIGFTAGAEFRSDLRDVGGEVAGVVEAVGNEADAIG